MNRPHRVCLFTRALELGGTERQLVTLAANLDRATIEPTVLTYYDTGQLRHELDAAGVYRDDLGKKGRWDIAGFTWRLAAYLRRARPDVLHSFLTTDNIFAAVVRRAVPDTRLIWGRRAGYMDLSRFDRAARISAKVEHCLLSAPDLIVTNSRAGLEQLKSQGVSSQRIAKVHNGVDTNRFRFNRRSRMQWRQAWGCTDDTVVIGCVARLDPMKGHQDLLSSLADIETAAEVKLICVGGGDEKLALALNDHAVSLGLRDRVIWTGPVDDPAPLYSAFDIHVSASAGEGFPNTVSEAMATGLINLATDVGECAAIIADKGRIVPVGDVAALTAGLQQLISTDPGVRRHRGDECRVRIENQYSVAAMTRAMTQLYLNISHDKGTPSALDSEAQHVA